MAVAVGGGGRGMGTPAAAAPFAPQRPTLAVDGTLRQLARGSCCRCWAACAWSDARRASRWLRLPSLFGEMPWKDDGVQDDWKDDVGVAAGGALTALSDTEEEWNEVVLKARAVADALVEGGVREEALVADEVIAAR